MKEHNRQIIFKTTVTLFLAVYLIGSFTNLLHIPRYVPDVLKVSVGGAPANSRALNANFSSTNYLQVFDRYTIDNDAFNELTFAPKSIDLGFGFNNMRFEINNIPPPQIHPYNYQYVYLSICTFRI
jgi:hypothetical protein